MFTNGRGHLPPSGGPQHDARAGVRDPEKVGSKLREAARLGGGLQCRSTSSVARPPNVSLLVFAGLTRKRAQGVGAAPTSVTVNFVMAKREVR